MSRFPALALLLVAFAASDVLTQTPATAPQPDAAPLADLRVPPGFKISAFASNLQGARLMAVSPEGVLLVARRRTHEVVALPDRDKNGIAEPEVILTGLTNAHSLAFKDGYLYIATTPAIMRVKWAGGRPAGEPEPFAELPNSTPSLHVSRTIRVGHRHEGRPPRRSRGRRQSRRRVGLLYQARCAREERRYAAARTADGARISRGAIEPGGTGRAGGRLGVTQITQITESSSSFLSPVICEIPDPPLQGPFGMHR